MSLDPTATSHDAESYPLLLFSEQAIAVVDLWVIMADLPT
jgi:hypothetical protein